MHATHPVKDESLEEGQILHDDNRTACACLLALQFFRHTPRDHPVLSFIPTAEHPSPDWHFILHEPHAFPSLPFQDIVAVIRGEKTCPYDRVATDLNPRPVGARCQRMVIEVEFEDNVTRWDAVNELLRHMQLRFGSTETGERQVPALWETIAMQSERRGGLTARYEMDVCVSACDSVIRRLMSRSSADAITLLYAETSEYTVDADGTPRIVPGSIAPTKPGREKIPLRISVFPRAPRRASLSPPPRRRSPHYYYEPKNARPRATRQRSRPRDRRSPSPTPSRRRARAASPPSRMSHERQTERYSPPRSTYRDLDEPSRSTTKVTLKYESATEYHGRRHGVERGRSRSPVQKPVHIRRRTKESTRVPTHAVDDSTSDELQTPDLGKPLPLMTSPATGPGRLITVSDLLDCKNGCSTEQYNDSTGTHECEVDSTSLQLAAIERNSLGLLDFLGMSSSSVPLPILIRANASELRTRMKKNELLRGAIDTDDIAALVIAALGLKGLRDSSQLHHRGTITRKTGLLSWSVRWHEFSATVGKEEYQQKLEEGFPSYLELSENKAFSDAESLQDDGVSSIENDSGRGQSTSSSRGWWPKIGR
ncbi:hypothetical protein CALCODRAFT_24312 [Calocera cornea HHB12733]|uniref:Uncharacterized protein n=1 Tax=Calocera cornea HHB12733 TaxID=1353952 RepID=A0A165J1M2_9BASI|nr:hypothetical protein CALCODRAFT_24312 [Calocera cornea HHB12733]